MAVLVRLPENSCHRFLFFSVRKNDLVTHLNGERVQGLLHTQVLQLMTSGGDRVTMRTIPLDQTSIKSGGKKRHLADSKMAKRNKKNSVVKRGSIRDIRRRSSLFRRLSDKRAACESSLSPTPSSYPGSSREGSVAPRSPPAVCRSPPVSRFSLPSCSSPSPIAPPAFAVPNFNRPSSLLGLKHKTMGMLRARCRRKSVGHVPIVSPLARTPSPAPPSPAPPSPNSRSPSPLTVPIYPDIMVGGRSFTPRKSGGEAKSLLRRALSPERAQNVAGKMMRHGRRPSPTNLMAGSGGGRRKSSVKDMSFHSESSEESLAPSLDKASTSG